MIIGIDFSLNNPGLCFKSKGQYKFTAFYNDRGRDPNKKILKAFEIHKELLNINAIDVVKYNRKVSSKDFLIREMQKMIDAYKIANLMYDYIKRVSKQEKVQISLEGFSYGSKGNSFIDMIQYNSYLRYILTKNIGQDNIFVFQPSHVKKNAGKGNANKNYMVKQFQENVFGDKKLEKTKFWKWIQEKEYPDKIPKPIDDLCDSYFLVRSLEFYLEKT